jgi:hypothetical protein
MGISESGKILIPGWKQASGTKGRVRRTHLLSNERNGDFSTVKP